MKTFPGALAVFMKGLLMFSPLFAMVGSPIQLVIIALIAFLLFLIDILKHPQNVGYLPVFSPLGHHESGSDPYISIA